ncbi:hypothetical protein GCM10018772_13140 [Streptomyces fumanus]|uniref:Uncharacterized protein n=1 Tax=Streptomyces fumanus TaxID=67302 RepID=A0A919A6L2_9ACTN|nr:hypothetical protein GCM10018772_13140 [Streptomyces fumanus]
MLGEAGLYESGGGGEATPYVDHEAVPQFGGVCVPEHVGRVVVAVAAERLSDDRVVRSVEGAAAERPAVFAPRTVAARTASFYGSVDGPEGRRGEGDEESGALADSAGDVLAAEEAHADEVEGVARVEAGAGGADGRSSVAAPDEETFARFVAGVVVVEDLAGCAVQGGGRAGQVDGVGTAAGRGDLLQPAGEVRILCEPDGVAVCFGELTQARRAVEDGAPVSRGVLRGDGGDLPGWAAVAARVMGAGGRSVMEITPCAVGSVVVGTGSADGPRAPADAAAPLSSGPGPAGTVALAVGAPHARHGHGRVFPSLVRCGRSR